MAKAKPSKSTEQSPEDRWLDFVNKSGFPLQLGLADRVKRSSHVHGWRVLYEEHEWHNDDDGGFIDIVLENEHKTMVLVVECKRLQNTEWIFLRPQVEQHAAGTKVVVSRCHEEVHRLKVHGWLDLVVTPQSPEVSYCIPASDKKERYTIEQIASDTVAATQALALEEGRLARLVGPLAFRVYAAVVVTVAPLKLCPFNPHDVSIDDGKLRQADVFEDAPYVHFRKQLSTSIDVPNSLRPGQLSRWKERSVMVVNASSFLDFLQQASFEGESLRRVIPF